MFGRFFVIALCGAGPAAQAQPLEERAAVQRICDAGPDWAVARAQQLRGDALVTASGVLPNPSVVVEHQRSLGGPQGQETTVGLAVPLGIGGRYFVLRDAARARSEQANLDASVTLFESALAFREAYLVAAADRARAAVLAEQQAALDALSSTIGGLTKGGEAASYDLLRQEAQARAHRRSLASANAKAAGSQALLEVLLGAPIEVLPLPLPTKESASIDPGEAGGPRLASLDAEARASELEERAAGRRWVPDLGLFAGYREATAVDETGRGVSLSLSVPLTFFDHGQGEAAQAAADKEIARASAESLRRHQQAQIRGARVRLELLGASVDASAVPEAAEVQAKARLLYAAGEASITELLEAFRAAEEARLGIIDVAAEIAALRLSIMRSAGTMFDTSLDDACLRRREIAP